MNNIIGQKKLLNKFNSYTIKTIPRVMLLIGAEGCGKKSFVSFLAQRLELDLVCIPKDITYDDIVSINQCPVNKLYLINLNEFTIKQQNKLLKFIEEPSKNEIIVLISNTDYDILETVKNRCVKFYFENYSIDELERFKKFDDKSIYSICSTPGQLQTLNDESFLKLVNLCDKIIEKVHLASFANTVSISKKLNFKEEYDKHDPVVFLNVLLSRLKLAYINTKNKKYLKEYCFVNKYVQELLTKTINKETFIINFLLNYKDFCKIV